MTDVEAVVRCRPDVQVAAVEDFIEVGLTVDGAVVAIVDADDVGRADLPDLQREAQADFVFPGVGIVVGGEAIAGVFVVVQES